MLLSFYMYEGKILKNINPVYVLIYKNPTY